MQHAQETMELSKPDCGYFVYKRKKKISGLDKGGKQTEEEGVLVLGTPVKLQTTKKYTRRNSIKFQNCPSISPAFELSSKKEVSQAPSAEELIQEQRESSNETGTVCFKVADDKGNDHVPLDTLSSSLRHHSRDYVKDRNTCTNRKADDMVCSIREKSNMVLADSCSKSPDSLGSSAVSSTLLDPQDIDGPVLDHSIDLKEETEAYVCEKSLDYGPDKDITFVTNKESVEVLNPTILGSKYDHFGTTSSSLVNNDKRVLEENNSFPGDHGFVLLQKRTESEKNPCAKSSESSVTEDKHPREKEGSQGVGRKDDMMGSRKTPRKKAKKRSHRPRIMVDGKISRKIAKVSMTEPATLRKKTVSKKRKKNEVEIVESGTLGKQNSSKRRKDEKTSKHESVVEPVTPTSLERGTVVKKFVIASVARALIFYQEDQPGVENLFTPPVHVDEHDNPNSNEIPKCGYATEPVIPPDRDLVGDPDSVMVRKVVENRLGNQKYHARETWRLSRKRNFLNFSKYLGPNFPELNKRRRTTRKPRADFLNLVFHISSAFQEEKSRNSKWKGNMSKAKRPLGFTWKKRSKRSARVRNISKWTEISLCNRSPKGGLVLLGSRETRNSHTKGIPKITCLAQDVQSNKAKEPILLHDNESRSLGADSRPTETSKMSKEMAWPHSINYQMDSSRQDMIGRKYSINSELTLSNSLTSLQTYDLAQNIGQVSCPGIGPYPLIQSSGHAFLQDHQFWFTNNSAQLKHEDVRNLCQNHCLLMHDGEVPLQNEDARALYQNQLPLRLSFYPAEIPLQLQETRSLYENFMRSFNYVPPIPNADVLYSGDNKRTKDIELLIQKMRSLDIEERALDLNVTITANRKQEKKKGKDPHSERQLIVLNHDAQGPNMLVPYQEKVKQKTSAKVLLDPETIKEWQLLMVNDLPDRPNADEDREKNWETEREFFKGRVDLFIKRMHLLQADRKFKQWKGSVVDSVVGVYLTQNVSDHLSSNAYISLAATFPIATEDTETREESVYNATWQFETVVNSEGLTYFIDEPPEEIKNWSMDNDSVVEDQGSTHVGTMSCKDLCTTLSDEIHSDGCTMLPCDGYGKVEHETSEEGTACESQRSSPLSSFKIQNLLNMEEMDRSIHVEGQGGETPELQEPQKATQKRNKKTGVMEDEIVDWKSIRRMYTKEGPRDRMQMDSVDWDAVRVSDQGAVATAIKDRGQQTIIAGRIKDFLNQEVNENGTIDLEWLRDAPPDLVKRYLLEINGLGLKSVECIRLLALKHIAFPVDTNVGRIAVRLGWVPLEPLPDEVQMHLLDQYPYMDSIQKYLWPRLCRLPQATLYELHYQMITFGKVFCTKKSPNCNACPMKAECKHFASAYASSQLRLPGLQDKRTENSDSFPVPVNPSINADQTMHITTIEEYSSPECGSQINSSEPIVEMPPSPTPGMRELIDIEDTPCRTLCQPNGEIPEIDVDMETFKKNVHDAMLSIKKMLNSRNDEEVSKALDSLTPENSCIPMPAPKMKYYSRLRTEHVVHVLPDNHELLQGFERREPDDPSPYLLTVWQPGEKSHSFTPPKKKCNSNGIELCNDQTCSYCCSIREENSKTLRGTILIPCRTAMRGRFPLNGTYFQINEVFADQQTSLEPIVFPRDWTHGLEKRALYCGSSVSAIFRGLDTRRIQLCFWTGYVCVRGFHRVKRIPQELAGRLHTPPNKRGKKFERDNNE